MFKVFNPHNSLDILSSPPKKELTSCLLHLLCSLWTPYPSVDPETQSTKMLRCMKADTRRSASDEDSSLGMNWISWSHLGCGFMDVIYVYEKNVGYVGGRDVAGCWPCFLWMWRNGKTRNGKKNMLDLWLLVIDAINLFSVKFDA